MIHRYIFALLLVCASSIHTVIAQAVQPASRPSAIALDQLYEQYYEEWAQRNPMGATFQGDLRYNDKLPNSQSAPERNASKAWTRKWLERLSKADTVGLSGEERLSYRILLRTLEVNVEGFAYDFGWMMPITQLGGIHSNLAQWGNGKSAVPFKTKKDYLDWLARLHQVPEIFDTLISNMRVGIKRGYVLPRPVVDKMVPQVKAHLSSDTSVSLFYGAIRQMPSTISATDRAWLAGAYASAISALVVPSYQKLYVFLTEEYVPAARASVGLSDLANGAEAYAFAVKSTTTTSLTPREIHDIGLREVARIQGEMKTVMTQVGFKGSLTDFFEHLRTNPKFYPFKEEKDILQTYENIRVRMMPQVNKLFPLQPKSRFEVRPVERFLASTTSASYSRGTADGSRPGVFNVPIPSVSKYQSFAMESLFLHEAIPGHHFQISLQLEMTGLPRFRTAQLYSGVTAFVEGWGLYSESLGRELGLYQDPYQYYGKLDAEIHRAIRLVLDTGIHSLGWTRQQAIDYSLANEGRDIAGITSEVERYIANPSQALAYKIGELKILELRKYAQSELGKKFSLAAFHQEVLRQGSMPLSLLEEKIQVWVKTQRGRR